jgi:phage-related holin
METHPIITTIKNALYIPTFLVACGIEQTMAYSTTVFITLMAIDVFTGILKSYRIHGSQSIKSTTMAVGILAKATMLLIPLVVALVGKGVMIDMDLVVRGVLYMLILSEGYSILGNIQSYKTGKDLPEFDAVSAIIKQIRKILLALMKKTDLSNK